MKSNLFARIEFGGALAACLALALFASDAFSQEKAQSAAPAGAAPLPSGDFIQEFKVDKGDLVSSGQNDYFILQPGYVLTYAATVKGKKTELTITVTNEIKGVDGVQTRVVEERETEDGKPAEISRNYFAIDKKTNDVYYFGEATTVYKDGKPEPGEDSWEAGVNGAKFGLAMPAKPTVGMKYYQEQAPKVAMDRARIVSLAAPFKAGDVEYSSCLQIEETSAVEPEARETKHYVKGIGQVNDGELTLTSHGFKNN